MRLKVWGARGSVPSPGPHMNRYGGNTSCVEVTLSTGETLIIDAGTGIRTLGFALPPDMPRINILLTHLHLDHIQGLMFFPPCFRAESEITIWGPSSPEASLEDRIARYISAPLSPVEVRELPCSVAFRDTPASEWELGGATIRAEAVTHRGPTLGYRVTEADRSVVYIPDHEPGLGTPLDQLEDEWISGLDLARGADVLVHEVLYLPAAPGAPGSALRKHVVESHTTAEDAGRVAADAGVKTLVLSHFVPAEAPPISDDQWLAAARAHFPGRIVVGRDLLEV